MGKWLSYFAVSGFLLTNSLGACELKMNKRLVIGCTYKCDFMYRLRLTLSARSLGYPIKIVDLREMGNLDQALTQVDGILMPGGADINPALYMDQVSPELKLHLQKNLHLAQLNDEGTQRDPFESEVLKKYSSDERFQKLPFLGICRGMQMMSVTQGIPLFLDLKTEVGIDNRKYVFDKVTMNEDSLMGRIYKNKTVKALKLHHQGLRVPYFAANADKYPQVKVTSFSHNRQIAESIEYTHRPALGVQYHPEMSFSETSNPVFKWFLSTSCEYKNAAKGI